MHWRAADTGREVPILRFSFAYLTPTEQHNLVADIIGLYEACLIDIGRTWPRWDFVYPQEGDVAHTQKRKKNVIVERPKRGDARMARNRNCM